MILTVIRSSALAAARRTAWGAPGLPPALSVSLPAGAGGAAENETGAAHESRRCRAGSVTSGGAGASAAARR